MPSSPYVRYASKVCSMHLLCAVKRLNDGRAASACFHPLSFTQRGCFMNFSLKSLSSIKMSIFLQSRSLRLLSVSVVSLTSIPGPIACAFLLAGKTYSPLAPIPHSPAILSYLRATPSQPKRRLMRKQLSKAQHQSVHKREQQVYGSTAQQTP